MAGAAGATGPTGVTGATGATGATGPSGDEVIRLMALATLVSASAQPNVIGVVGNLVADPDFAPEWVVQFEMPVDCVYGNLRVRIAPVAGLSGATLTLRVNGLNTSVSCILDASGQCSNNVNTYFVTAGDLVNYRLSALHTEDLVTASISATCDTTP